MDKQEVLFHWNYFRSLCARLDATRSFVSHETIKKETGLAELKYADVSSFEFEQILILNSVEFENVAKEICHSINPQFNMKWSDIVHISETILTKYPRITEVTVFSDYQTLQPLKNWGVEDRESLENGKTKKIVTGLKWWNDYSDLKHQGFLAFEKANLENAIMALASLMVLDLYLIQSNLQEVRLACSHPCEYFNSEFADGFLLVNGTRLPDFKESTDSTAE